MKNYLLLASVATSVLLSGCASVNTAHTPPDGSAERNAILQATQDALARQGRKHLVLDVPYLKVHNGWAWIQVNPRSPNGTQHYESQSGLLQDQANKWKLLEWMPAEEGTDYKTYFKNLKAKYPAAPVDIFPQ
ncbi:MAG TPA: hypothetical protein VGM65_09175 [Candidatus Udaeobacter sp.]|jgi:uncharacterized protein YceK